MFAGEVVGELHGDSDDEYEEDYELFEGHEGGEGHDGHAVAGEDVDGAHDEGVGQDVDELLFGDGGFALGVVVEIDDEYSLDEEDLSVECITME